MDELTIGDKTYISSKQAAKITGYAKDYVGQLCREGRVEARLVGRNWYVLESSIREHRFGTVVQESKSEPEPSQDSRPYTWSAPVYVPEEPAIVPTLAPKEPEIVASRKIVSEMQTAWQEWFAEMPRTAAQESNALQVENQEQEINEPVQDAEVADVPDSDESDEYEEPVTVHYQAVHEVMDLTRHHSDLSSGYEVEEIPSFQDDREQEEVVVAEAPETQSSYGLLRSIFITSAVIAAMIAILGTGVVADVLLNNADNSVTAEVGRFLGGESEHFNSK